MQRTVTLIIIVCMTAFAFWLFAFDEKSIMADNASGYITVKNGAGLGKDASAPKNPKRIIALSSSDFEIIMKIGGSDKVVAAPKFNYVPKWVYEKMPAHIKDLGQPGSISIESIMAHKPDLLLASGMAGSQQLNADFFIKENISVITIPTQSLEDILLEIKTLGVLTGEESNAEREIERIKTNISLETKRNVDKKRKKVLMVFGTSTSFSMITPSSRQGDVLKLAGGENIIADTSFGSKYVPFSLEFAAQADPDFVLFVNHGNKEKMQLQMEKALTDSSAWNVIRAVREKRAYVLPPELFAVNPGLRLDEAVMYLSKLLYPDE